MPRSVAVVGASHREYRASHHVVKGLREGGFAGGIFPVNPKLDTLLGCRVFHSIGEIPEVPELAYIAIPAQLVPSVLRECGLKGVHTAIIYSSGFSETGPEGRRLEEEVAAVAAAYDISFLGPNCIGVADCFSKNTYYSDVPLEPGFTSLISHSGSLCGTITRMSWERGIRLARAVSLGNRAGLSTCDFLEYLGEDPRTQLIVMYLESIEEGRRFAEALARVTARKPVLLWKSGRTSSGARAASSHTAALASDHAVLRAVCRQAGVVECQGIEDLLDQMLIFQSGLKASGTRLGIVSAPGGVAVAAADACEEQGLELARYSESTLAALARIVPRFGSAANPVDLTTQVFFDLSLYTKAIGVVMADDGVDLVLIVAPAEMHPVEFARLLNGHCSGWRKPFAVSLTVPLEIFQTELRIVRERVIPLFPTVERAVKALAVYARRGLRSRSAEPHDVAASSAEHAGPRPTHGAAGHAAPGGVAPAPRRPRGGWRSEAREWLRGLGAEREGPLDEELSRAFLRTCGIPVVPEAHVDSEEEAVRAAVQIGFPVVLKGLVAGVAHKTELGLVKCGLRSEAELRRGYQEIAASIGSAGLKQRCRGTLIQEWVDIRLETIAGLKRDTTFGAVLMFGVGGIAVELLSDVVFRMAPIDPAGVEQMLQSLRAYPLLAGYREQPAVDLPGLEEILIRLGEIGMEFSEVRELEINPLAARTGGGFAVVDALLVLQPMQARRQ
jgi:acyl-CoA synthetase (NDP forming)